MKKYLKGFIGKMPQLDPVNVEKSTIFQFMLFLASCTIFESFVAKKFLATKYFFIKSTRQRSLLFLNGFKCLIHKIFQV